MRPTRLAGLLLLFGCNLPEQGAGPGGARQTAEIVGGSPDTRDPAVLSLRSFGNQCSASLIGRRAVLTAAHCTGPFGAGLNLFYQLSASGVDAGTLSIAAQHVHPGYSSSGQQHDLAIFQLAQPVANIEPLPLPSRLLAPADVGRDVRLVGFGANASDGSGKGVKREATYPLRELGEYFVESGATGKQTCDGDSGGPALLALSAGGPEHLIGVTSHGDQDCLLTGYSARTDIDLEWIRTTVGAWETLPTCGADGLCLLGCTPVDVDCACRRDGACTAACPEARLDPDCPSDCAANGVCALEACPHPDPDCRADGAACEREVQCPGRRCVGSPGYCSRPCSAQDCAPGLECREGSCQRPLGQPPATDAGAAPPGELAEDADGCQCTSTPAFPLGAVALLLGRSRRRWKKAARHLLDRHSSRA